MPQVAVVEKAYGQHVQLLRYCVLNGRTQYSALSCYQSEEMEIINLSEYMIRTLFQFALFFIFTKFI